MSSSVGMMIIPNINGKSIQIPWFQSAPAFIKIPSKFAKFHHFLPGPRCPRYPKVLFVHEIRMSVMHPGAQHRIAPLQQGAEGHLGARREVAHGAQVALFWPTQGRWGWGKARVDDMETQIFPKYLGNISWMTCWMMEIQMTVLFFSVSEVFLESGLRTYMGYNTSCFTHSRDDQRCLTFHSSIMAKH